MEVYFKPSDIVWVKLGPFWWPGEVVDRNNVPTEVTESLKKDPVAIVKFFDDFYECVKTSDHIYHYNCERKNDFIKKGMDAFRAKNPKMSSFPKDVSAAEVKTGGNANILSDPMFTPERKRNYAAEIFGTPVAKKPKDINKGSSKTSPIITHRRFLGYNDYEARILIQTEVDPEAVKTTTSEIPAEDKFTCPTCEFVTDRLGILLMHVSCHVKGEKHITGPPLKKSPKRKRKKLLSDDDLSGDDKNVKTKRKYKKKVASDKYLEADNEKKDNDVLTAEDEIHKPKPKQNDAHYSQPTSQEKKDICTDIIADWDDESNQDPIEVNENSENSIIDSSVNETLNSENIDIEVPITADSTLGLSEPIEEKPNSNLPTEEISEKKCSDATEDNKGLDEKAMEKDPKTSCFDFDEDEEDTRIPDATSGRKIPRVIPISDKRKSFNFEDDIIEDESEEQKQKVLKESEQLGKSSECEVEDAETEELQKTYQSLMESTSPILLPDIPNILKSEQNFHCAKTVKYPDKPKEEISDLIHSEIVQDITIGDNKSSQEAECQIESEKVQPDKNGKDKRSFKRKKGSVRISRWSKIDTEPSESQNNSDESKIDKLMAKYSMNPDKYDDYDDLQPSQEGPTNADEICVGNLSCHREGKNSDSLISYQKESTEVFQEIGNSNENNTSTEKIHTYNVASCQEVTIAVEEQVSEYVEIGKDQQTCLALKNEKNNSEVMLLKQTAHELELQADASSPQSQENENDAEKDNQHCSLSGEIEQVLVLIDEKEKDQPNITDSESNVKDYNSRKTFMNDDKTMDGKKNSSQQEQQSMQKYDINVEQNPTVREKILKTEEVDDNKSQDSLEKSELLQNASTLRANEKDNNSNNCCQEPYKIDKEMQNSCKKTDSVQINEVPLHADHKDVSISHLKANNDKSPTKDKDSTSGFSDINSLHSEDKSNENSKVGSIEKNSSNQSKPQTLTSRSRDYSRHRSIETKTKSSKIDYRSQGISKTSKSPQKGIPKEVEEMDRMPCDSSSRGQRRSSRNDHEKNSSRKRVSSQSKESEQKESYLSPDQSSKRDKRLKLHDYEKEIPSIKSGTSQSKELVADQKCGITSYSNSSNRKKSSRTSNHEKQKSTEQKDAPEPELSITGNNDTNNTISNREHKSVRSVADSDEKEDKSNSLVKSPKVKREILPLKPPDNHSTHSTRKSKERGEKRNESKNDSFSSKNPIKTDSVPSLHRSSKEYRRRKSQTPDELKHSLLSSTSKCEVTTQKASGSSNMSSRRDRGSRDDNHEKKKEISTVNESEKISSEYNRRLSENKSHRSSKKEKRSSRDHKERRDNLNSSSVTQENRLFIPDSRKIMPQCKTSLNKQEEKQEGLTISTDRHQENIEGSSKRHETISSNKMLPKGFNQLYEPKSAAVLSDHQNEIILDSQQTVETTHISSEIQKSCHADEELIKTLSGEKIVEFDDEHSLLQTEITSKKGKINDKEIPTTILKSNQESTDHTNLGPECRIPSQNEQLSSYDAVVHSVETSQEKTEYPPACSSDKCSITSTIDQTSNTDECEQKNVPKNDAVQLISCSKPSQILIEPLKSEIEKGADNQEIQSVENRKDSREIAGASDPGKNRTTKPSGWDQKEKSVPKTHEQELERLKEKTKKSSKDQLFCNAEPFRKQETKTDVINRNVAHSDSHETVPTHDHKKEQIESIFGSSPLSREDQDDCISIQVNEGSFDNSALTELSHFSQSAHKVEKSCLDREESSPDKISSNHPLIESFSDDLMESVESQVARITHYEEPSTEIKAKDTIVTHVLEERSENETPLNTTDRKDKDPIISILDSSKDKLLIDNGGVEKTEPPKSGVNAPSAESITRQPQLEVSVSNSNQNYLLIEKSQLERMNSQPGTSEVVQDVQPSLSKTNTEKIVISEVATKLTNPKKRFVKSFEDFELNKQRQRPSNEKQEKAEEKTTAASGTVGKSPIVFKLKKQMLSKLSNIFDEENEEKLVGKKFSLQSKNSGSDSTINPDQSSASTRKDVDVKNCIPNSASHKREMAERIQKMAANVRRRKELGKSEKLKISLDKSLLEDRIKLVKSKEETGCVSSAASRISESDSASIFDRSNLVSNPEIREREIDFSIDSSSTENMMAENIKVMAQNMYKKKESEKLKECSEKSLLQNRLECGNSKEVNQLQTTQPEHTEKGNEMNKNVIPKASHKVHFVTDNSSPIEFDIKTNLSNIGKSEGLSELVSLANIPMRQPEPMNTVEEGFQVDDSKTKIITKNFPLDIKKEEPELVTIDGNLTVVSEKELAEEVEITASMSNKKPITLLNLSMDFSDDSSDASFEFLRKEKIRGITESLEFGRISEDEHVDELEIAETNKKCIDVESSAFPLVNKIDIENVEKETVVEDQLVLSLDKTEKESVENRNTNIIDVTKSQQPLEVDLSKSKMSHGNIPNKDLFSILNEPGSSAKIPIKSSDAHSTREKCKVLDKLESLPLPRKNERRIAQKAKVSPPIVNEPLVIYNTVKSSTVPDLCDLEDHIPSQIVCVKNALMHEDVMKVARINNEMTNEMSLPKIEPPISKLLNRLTSEKPKEEDKSKIKTIPVESDFKQKDADSKSSPLVSNSTKTLIKAAIKIKPQATAATSLGKSGNKAIILSERIIRPARDATHRSTLVKRYEDVEDIKPYIIARNKKPENKNEPTNAGLVHDNVTTSDSKISLIDSSSKSLSTNSSKQTLVTKPSGKAKILNQTIIRPASEMVQTKEDSSLEDNIDFDINSMPIVISDELLTPESLENMSLVLNDKIQKTHSPENKVGTERKQSYTNAKVLNKTVTMPTGAQSPILRVPQLKKTQMPKILQSPGQSQKIIRHGPSTQGSSKPGKYIILPENLNKPMQVVKKQNTDRSSPGSQVASTMPNASSESTGHKIMIVTNQQGQQQRLLLTPAHQKMFGMQLPKAGKTIMKSTVAQKISHNKIQANIQSTVPSPRIQTTCVVSSKQFKPSINDNQSLSSQFKVSPKKIQKVGQQISKRPQQKTILIKNQHGQTVRKIQGTDDALLDKQVAEQLEAIKVSSLKAHQKQQELTAKASGVIKPVAPTSRRSYLKKPEVKQISISQTKSIHSSKSNISETPKLPSQVVPPLTPIKSDKKPEGVQKKLDLKPVDKKPLDRPLNQLVIQDNMGNQTTVTEGQILALPSETLDGQPQSYMLVTLDEAGNLTPLNNEALMSLDPSLAGLTGSDLSNMVLQMDTGVTRDGGSQTVQLQAAAPATPTLNALKEDSQVPEVVHQELQQKPVKQTVPSIEEASPQVQVTCNINGESGQQIILTGDPVATQKFLDSLSEGSTDLANILANAEGSSFLIQADGQQILINTDPNDAQLLQTSLNSVEPTEQGNPMFANHPGKNQDILAAALADTDVFQQDQVASQNKVIHSQLSPGQSLFSMNVGNVLETSLTLNSPIMTPLEVPSISSKKIPDEEADILTTHIPKNIDLPITITDPNISQTVAHQQVLMASDLQSNLELSLPLSETVMSVTSEMNSPSYVYSLPNLDVAENTEISQKSFSSSMPLLTEDIDETTPSRTLSQEVTIMDSVDRSQTTTTNSSIIDGELKQSVVESLNSERPGTITSDGTFMEEGLCTLGGEMCSSLSEPPPEMFDIPISSDNLSFLNSRPQNRCKTKLNLSTMESALLTDENSMEIPVQPQIVADLKDSSLSTDVSSPISDRKIS